MRISRLLLGAVLLVALAVLAAWLARRPLSEAVVARWLAGRQVEARYRIDAISPTEVTLSAVALGPVGRPDFTAERIVAAWSPLRARVDTAILVRPRLRATLSSDGISFGSLDRLLPKSDTPQPLPDIDVRLIDARVDVATPLGKLTGRADGSGRLRDSFVGVARFDPATLAAGGCSLVSTGATLRLTTMRDGARLTGQGVVPRLACTAGRAEAVAWNLAATLPPNLDRYAATLGVKTALIEAAGASAASAVLTATATAASLKAPIAGRFQVGARDARSFTARARRASANGSYSFNPAKRLGNARAALAVEATAIQLPDARRIARAAAGTLVEQLVRRFANRAGAAARAFDASAQVTVASAAEFSLTGVVVRSRSGARLDQTGRIMLTLARRLRLHGDDVRVSLSGGGLPATTVTGSGTLQDGTATVAAALWRVPGATLDALRLTARATGGTVAVEGGVRASGALGGGVVAQRFGIPVDLRAAGGGLSFGTSCLAVDWAGLARDTVRIAPGRVRACPAGGAMVRLAGTRLGGSMILDGLALRGRSGATPLSLASSPVRLGLSGSSDRPALSVAPTRFEAVFGGRRLAATIAASLDPAARRGSGRIVTASLADPASPFVIGDGRGDWRWAGARVALGAASARLTDRSAPARFEPLRITGVSADLADGRIAVRGSAALAANGVRLFGFTAAHDLASATGSATLATGTLLFGSTLQPYQLTENLRGIVENVVGPVIGTGAVAWTATALTSRGTLRIDKLNLATAALGPVEGIAGSIDFDDLLALTTPPAQRLTVARINPGIAVDDGVVRFRMLAPDAAAIESIVWPYAGGTLSLAPVTIRSTDLRRDFQLAVDNLDAEQFLQKFEIKNLNVTGRFDGILPLVFVDGKGRIVAGRLVAQGGGLVQYVGDAASADLGAGARLAFDALRRLRYQELALDLDGDLDGELVTQLRFSGKNETAATLGGGPLPIRATGLPFKFNVVVRAPFRALLGTAASFSDVRPLIRTEQVQPR